MGEAEKRAVEGNLTDKTNSYSVSIKPDQDYSIKEVRVLAGLKTSQALRNLERAGRIPPSGKDASGMRVWKGSDVLKILNRPREKTHRLDTAKKSKAPVVKAQEPVVQEQAPVVPAVENKESQE
jgi:hypothetical protein